MQAVERLVNFLKIPVLGVFFAYLTLCACHNLGGADYLFHVKAGEYILGHKDIPRQDIFSFTAKGRKWVDHEWLYQAFVYLLYQKLGLDGLFLLQITIFSLAFFVLSVFILKTEWMFGFPLLVYGLRIACWRFTFRPDNVSFLLFVLFLAPFVLKKKRLLFLLPFLQIFWVNAHGFFFLGPLVVALYLILARIKKNEEFDRDFYHTAGITFILTLLASLLTPQVLHVLAYPFSIVKDIVSGRQELFYRYIQELESPFRNLPRNALFFGYLAATLVFLSVFRRINLFYLGLGIIFIFFSLNSLRNMYFIVPVGIACFVDRYPRIKDFLLERIVKEKGFLCLRLLFAALSLLLCIQLAQKISSLPRAGRAYITRDGKVQIKGMYLSRDPRGYPQDMIDFIGETPLPSRMFNSFNMGAFLIFNFFPQREVFIDGRAELYGEDFFCLYNRIENADESAFDAAVRDYRLRGFIISYFRDAPPALIKLVHEKGYKCVYFDGFGIIFVQDSALEDKRLKERLIDFAGMPVRKVSLLDELKTTRPSAEGYFNMASVLYTLGYYDKSREFLEEILNIAPDHAGGYYLLGKIRYKEGRYQDAFYHCRRSLFFRPSSIKARKLLASIYIKTGRHDDAREVLNTMRIDVAEFLKEMEHER
jgi:tetratricopeptide (TPR) repeat protein